MIAAAPSTDKPPPSRNAVDGPFEALLPGVGTCVGAQVMMFLHGPELERAMEEAGAHGRRHTIPWIKETDAEPKLKRRKKADVLEYGDENGRFAAFHPSRQTFITNAALDNP